MILDFYERMSLLSFSPFSSSATNFFTIFSQLLAAQRTAALRHDDDLQATLLPLLLRNYLEHHLYDQADRLLSKTTFPEGTAGNAQLARYYYYVGRIRAIQLNYTEAHSNLQQAIRRAPDPKVAPGFLQTVSSLSFCSAFSSHETLVLTFQLFQNRLINYLLSSNY